MTRNLSVSFSWHAHRRCVAHGPRGGQGLLWERGHMEWSKRNDRTMLWVVLYSNFFWTCVLCMVRIDYIWVEMLFWSISCKMISFQNSYPNFQLKGCKSRPIIFWVDRELRSYRMEFCTSWVRIRWVVGILNEIVSVTASSLKYPKARPPLGSKLGAGVEIILGLPINSINCTDIGCKSRRGFLYHQSSSIHQPTTEKILPCRAHKKPKRLSLRVGLCQVLHRGFDGWTQFECLCPRCWEFCRGHRCLTTSLYLRLGDWDRLLVENDASLAVFF